MTDYQAVANSYITIWNETDEAKRAELAEQFYTSDASYIDPMAQAEGVDTIVATIGAVQQQFPGWTFRLVGAVDGHHSQLRLTWALGPETAEDSEDTDGTAAAPIVGFDVVVLTDEGQVSAVYGFLDRVPAAA